MTTPPNISGWILLMTIVLCGMVVVSTQTVPSGLLIVGLLAAFLTSGKVHRRTSERP